MVAAAGAGNPQTVLDVVSTVETRGHEGAVQHIASPITG
jgi:hypothetical protein